VDPDTPCSATVRSGVPESELGSRNATVIVNELVLSVSVLVEDELEPSFFIPELRQLLLKLMSISPHKILQLLKLKI